MSWHYLQEQEAVSWDPTSSDGAPSALLSMLPIPGASYSPGSVRDACQGSPSGMTCEPSTGGHGEDTLTSLPEASPAKTSQQREREPVSKANAPAFGERWRASLARYDRNMHLWRTAQCSLLEGLDVFSETWPRWGMMRNGECWELSTLAPRIEESGSGLWPTPRAKESTESAEAIMRRAETGRYGVNMNLTAAVKLWPRVHRSPGGASEMRRHTPDLPTQVGGQLNPPWVEWLMGWPVGWTDLQPLAMDKFQQWLDSHGRR